ncbi:gliding motility-associated C-terminal domain-containing protein [Flavobacterium humidisoli]|uniref:Gliding motility-associated C-terminal domain-containing protein n=1 Tax=Flavobacterium humidisoli TaxID=2937442 RepID=A0ABY4LYB0_9FLAO|nr:gliding motility-associated C-terminal domain-containing protein [Flavobacterium humidisoli]UPZ18066.1 gliding motility-associated C-terminal domain-containing protein [Flavobacterium humidisoli]
MSDFNNYGIYENNGEVIFKGNFNNDGVSTYNPAYSGYTRFEGNLPQNISGSILSEFNKVLFNNNYAGPAFLLSGDITINSGVEFLRGIVDDDSYGGSIIFLNNAEHIGSSDQSYVDGYVMKEGNSEFLYPVGDQNHFRSAHVSAPFQSNTNVICKYFFENSKYTYEDKEPVITDIDDTEYWSLENSTGAKELLVTLSWDERTTEASIITDPIESLHVVRWDEKRKLWIDEGGIVDKNAKTVRTASFVSGYGIFTLARVKLEEEGLFIYNGITPNGDGVNDYFLIDGIKNYKNKVMIYNRWGAKVFETNDYDTRGNVFDGFSEGTGTVKEKKGLPDGTYFYVVEYEYDRPGFEAGTIKKAGYLYLKKN